jgi:allantoin racemase
MNIAYMVPGVGLSQEERLRRQAILERIAPGSGNIKLYEVDEGPNAIETSEDEIAAAKPLLRLARSIEAESDVMVIGCFGDVGISLLRDNIGVPVVGPARATYAVAGAAYPGFAVLSLNSGFVEEERGLIERLGLTDRLGRIVALDVPVQQIIDQPDATLETIQDRLSGLQAPAVVPGCMSMAFLLAEKGVSTIGGARVVNPLICALSVSAALVA